MTELELLIDFHKDAYRQGPGSSFETIKALNLIGVDKNKNLKIADIGCGTGAQTIDLAQNTNAKITAVDLFPEFLEKLNRDAEKLGLQDRISTLEQSMEELSFSAEEFDIIWSEGAIYIMGFEKGIKEWRKYLKTGGYIAVSEITWTTDSRPKEVEDHWNNEYPEIDTVSNKIKILEKNGYSPIAHFILPQNCWFDNYYSPIENRFSDFLERNKNSELANELVNMEKEEIKTFNKYMDYYSYGFYIAKKI